MACRNVCRLWLTFSCSASTFNPCRLFRGCLLKQVSLARVGENCCRLWSLDLGGHLNLCTQIRERWVKFVNGPRRKYQILHIFLHAKEGAVHHKIQIRCYLLISWNCFFDLTIHPLVHCRVTSNHCRWVLLLSRDEGQWTVLPRLPKKTSARTSIKLLGPNGGVWQSGRDQQVHIDKYTLIFLKKRTSSCGFDSKLTWSGLMFSSCALQMFCSSAVYVIAWEQMPF